MRHLHTLGTVVAASLLACSAQAATITFSGVPAASGKDPGWWGNPSVNYQPLMGGYTVGSTTDGGDLGVSVDMTRFISDRGFDHTADAPTNYFVKGWSGSQQNLWTMTFGSPVSISSFFATTDWNAGSHGETISVYTTPDDTTPAKTITLPWTAVWNGSQMVAAYREFTDFADLPIQKFVLTMAGDGGGSNVQIDDMTISVPEPATMGMAAIGCAALMLKRRRIA